ncbi:GNAT family N-acetyltransferase [Pontibacter russatus]|uniref:GNAT family N-acetyltransferase n=1 Tax=Pontibacter russatus TaxID=2694929 RepID=UPI00137A0499|nr:GNAT family N-acetyltransferase [Pontibacter russatus]
MSPNYHIRPATAQDLPAILYLAEATWAPTYHSILSREQVAYMFGEIYAEEALARQMQEGQTFLLLLEDNRPIGFAAYSAKSETEAIYKLNKLYLLPECQGKGYGKALLSAVEAAAKHRGARLLDLNVNRHNKAKQFYERCGYRVHAQEDIPIGPFWMNDYVMRKPL